MQRRSLAGAQAHTPFVGSKGREGVCQMHGRVMLDGPPGSSLVFDRRALRGAMAHANKLLAGSCWDEPVRAAGDTLRAHGERATTDDEHEPLGSLAPPDEGGSVDDGGLLLAGARRTESMSAGS